MTFYDCLSGLRTLPSPLTMSKTLKYAHGYLEGFSFLGQLMSGKLGFGAWVLASGILCPAVLFSR